LRAGNIVSIQSLSSSFSFLKWVAASALLTAMPAGICIAGEKMTVFEDVSVIPMDQERLLEHQSVVVSGGVIVAIGDSGSIRIPPGAEQVSGQGRFLLPGLADMHAHISGWAEDGVEDSHEEVARSELLLYLATGVTTLRNTAGSEAHLELIRKIESGEITGPRMFTASPLIEGENAVWPVPDIVTDPSDADALLSRFAGQGYTMVKVYHTVSGEVYRALSAAAARYGLEIIGHVSFDVGIDLALENGQHSIEHLRGYDFDGATPEALARDGGRSAERFATWLGMTARRRGELASATAAAGTWNCPTLVINELLFDDDARDALGQNPMLRYVHPRVRANIASNVLDTIFGPEAKAMMARVLPKQYEMIVALNEAGAGLLVGTDTMVPYLIPGFTPIDEIEHFVAAGLSPWDALKAATKSPAESLGVLADSGTINIGKRADLVLLDANPLEDVSNLWKQAGVMVNGRWIARAEMMQLLEQLAASYPTEETRDE
jgi:imidazolonepropionase-like amidohydrolase